VFFCFWILISFGIIYLNFINYYVPLLFLNPVCLILFVIFIGYYGIIRNNSLKKLEITENNEEKKEETDAYSYIEDYINNEKPFLQTELTINDLASSLNIPAHKLSKILNSFYNKTFFDYINSKRIEFFKKKIEQEEHHTYSIISLAFDSGFNSKSAFYRYFKKLEGITPGDYINKMAQ
jgi:AraC-like DNA-binding protein